jgi:hypothetical protein
VGHIVSDSNPNVVKRPLLLIQSDVAGEYIRSNLTEDVAGIPVHYEFQILDVETCEPLVGAYFEIFRELCHLLLPLKVLIY